MAGKDARALDPARYDAWEEDPTRTAALERDGMVASAHGFRPRKTLDPAYQLLESLEAKLGESRKH